MKPLHDVERQLAEAAARVVVKGEEIGLPAPEKLAPPATVRLLSRAFIELRDQIRALHDLVDQTDPNDPIGSALTKVGLARRPSDWSEPGPRLLLTAEQITRLATNDLVELYRRARGHEVDFTKHETFIVRAWDGSDGCWTDCTGEIACDEALRYWARRTDGGARHISYNEIDYCRIFPGGTRLTWDGSNGREMHR